MTFIKTHPFLSLAVASLLVALAFWDFQQELHPVVVFFGLYAAFLMLVSMMNTHSFPVEKVSRKQVKELISAYVEDEQKLLAKERSDAFLARGQKDTVFTPDELSDIVNTRGASDLDKKFVALHPNTKAVILEQLAMSGDKSVLAAVAANPRTPASVRNDILYTKLSDIHSQEAQVSLLDDATTPGAVLQRIFEQPYDVEMVNEALLRHPNTSAELFDALTDSNSLAVLVAIAGSDNIIGNSKLIAKLKGFTPHPAVTLALLTNADMDRKTMEMFDLINYDRVGINSIVRDKTVEMNEAVLAYVARNSPVMKRMLAERIKRMLPKYEAVPNTDLLEML